MLARAYRENGRLDEAGQRLRAAADVLARSAVYRSLECTVLLEQGALALERSQADEALAIYWQCAALTRTFGDQRRQALALDGIGRALLQLERAKEAADFACTAATLAGAHAMPFDAAVALAHHGDALACTGLHEQAAATRTEGEALLDAYTDPRAMLLRQDLADAARDPGA